MSDNIDQPTRKCRSGTMTAANERISLQASLRRYEAEVAQLLGEAHDEHMRNLNDPDYVEPPDTNDPDETWHIAEILDPEPPPVKQTNPVLEAAVARYVTKHRLLTTRQLLDMPEPDWFIEGLVPKSRRLVLHGEPGSKKTFLALDLAVCAEHGLDWHGRKISQGKVFYILGEGTTFLGKRLRALAARRRMPAEDIKVTWMAEPLNLFKSTPEQCELWAAFVRHFKFKYIVVDTLHMNTAGMGENDSQDMGIALANASKIAGDADLIFIHHNTKSGGVRGSSSLEGDCDTIIEVKSTGPLTSKLKSGKIRDAEGFDNVELTFKEHEDSASIYLDTVGAPTPAITNVNRIISILLAEPFTHSRSAVTCMLGDTGAVQKTFGKMKDDGWIISETRASKSGRGPKMIDVWAVDEDNVPMKMLP